MIPSVKPVNDVARRPYERLVKRGEAPAAVLAAARDLFVSKGYVATSIEDIATAAGVARPTVFTAVGPKATILKLVVDHAMAGDSADVPVAQRRWWNEAIDEPDPRRSLALHARNLTAILGRVALLLREVESAAAYDPAVDDLWQELQRQRHAAMTMFTSSLRTKTNLRISAETAATTMWALSPDSYLRLVRDAGWTPKRYERWLFDTLRTLLLPPGPSRTCDDAVKF